MLSDARVIFTASPVPLERVFRKETGIPQENLLSESTLFVDIREFVQTQDSVYCFSSFEMATGIGSEFFKREICGIRRIIMLSLLQSFLSSR